MTQGHGPQKSELALNLGQVESSKDDMGGVAGGEESPTLPL